MLASLYSLVIRESDFGNDGFILANDADQAGDDLDLAKKIVAANPDLTDELSCFQREIRRQDGRGKLEVLPAKDIAGAHGKTALFLGFDEIHSYRTYDLFEALAPDPTRVDVLVWITSYDTIYNSPGVPLFDLKAIGKAGTDPRMLFSWYSGDFCSDPNFAELEPELRANPSIASWPDGRAYLDQQRRRLPTSKYRRLHLNLPGAPNGAFFDQGAVLAATIRGRRKLPPESGNSYRAFVDMSGGSSDDAVLAIAHKDDGGKYVLDLVEKQAGDPPFNPRAAVTKFVAILNDYGITKITGDNYAGETFKQDFAEHQIEYVPSQLTKTEIYEAFEPLLNAGEVELLDVPKLQEQLLTLVVRGSKVDHQNGEHDDWANSVCGCIQLLSTPLVEYRELIFSSVSMGFERDKRDFENRLLGGAYYY